MSERRRRAMSRVDCPMIPRGTVCGPENSAGVSAVNPIVTESPKNRIGPNGNSGLSASGIVVQPQRAAKISIPSRCRCCSSSRSTLR
ncbi:hypothetical protein FOHLNKBM_3633 [Methylobacterium longum]|nr:hypothetical protein FOHLNKBM_3633 [Methylobacterium longum]